MRFSILAIVAPLFVASCSTIVYQEPAAGPRARVRYVTDSNSVSVLRTYGDENCATNETEWMRLRNGMLLNSSPKRLGMPLWNYHDNAAKEIYVEANKPIHALFHGGETVGLTTYACATPFSFSFNENTDYEVRFKWATKACGVSIFQLIKNPDGVAMQEVATFTNQATGANKGCLARLTEKRLY